METDLLGLGSAQPPTRQTMTKQQLQVEKERLKKELVPNFDLLNEHIQGRIEDILVVLLSVADKKMLQSYSRMGLLEETPLLRSHVWKLLLESLPLKHTLWRQRKHCNYTTYLKLLESQMYSNQDDLVGLGDNNFDQALWEQIVLDTNRTHSSLNFFQTEVHEIKVYSTKPTKHSDILTRILYVWAKVNGSVRYVQGMNEILAPLYYLEFQQIKKESESEVFFMFSALITPVIDMHIKDMDKCEQGILGRMMTLNKYLKAVDYQLWQKLHQQAIHPHFYTFRWLALMLSQQFGLYDTMRIWDILLSYDSQRRFRYLYCLCLGILKLRKHQIMNSQFTYILPKLHKLKDLQVTDILEIASRLYQKVSKVDIDKLLQRQEERRKEEAEKAKKEEGGFYKRTGDIFSKIIGRKE